MKPVLISIISLGLLLTFSAHGQTQEPPLASWWKGNLHTHSLWSDGDDYPEMIVDWYKKQGYHFLALSDHNVLSEGTKWITPATNQNGTNALNRYLNRFDPTWVEQQIKDGKLHVRLKPLGEFRHFFEEPQRFLLVQSEELTARYKTAPIHINVTNPRYRISPQGGESVLEVMQNNVNAILEQRRQTGQPMLPHLNHPNFGWGVTAEELMRVQGENFFEVYNGHPHVHNSGDAIHADTEKIWDIILTWRLAVLHMAPIFGLAVDDSHNYHQEAPGESNPGRGWIMARTRYLTPEHLIDALEKGEFYASTGVQLKDVQRKPGQLSLEIKHEEGVTYRTQFIGTRKGFDQTSVPVRTASGEALRVTHRYSPDVGKLLHEVDGTMPSYKFRGDEIYVRARVISSKRKTNPLAEEEFERAWTQPAVGVEK